MHTSPLFVIIENVLVIANKFVAREEMGTHEESRVKWQNGRHQHWQRVYLVEICTAAAAAVHPPAIDARWSLDVGVKHEEA